MNEELEIQPPDAEEPDTQWLADKINRMPPDAKRRLVDLLKLDPDIQESIRKAQDDQPA